MFVICILYLAEPSTQLILLGNFFDASPLIKLFLCLFKIIKINIALGILGDGNKKWNSFFEIRKQGRMTYFKHTLLHQIKVLFLKIYTCRQTNLYQYPFVTFEEVCIQITCQQIIFAYKVLKVTCKTVEEHAFEALLVWNKIAD